MYRARLKGTRNVASRIASHNAKMIRGSKASGKAGCKCRDKTSCPMPGDCKSKNIVYSALIDSEVGFFNYYGMTSMCFKDRYNNHKYDYHNYHIDIDNVNNGEVNNAVNFNDNCNLFNHKKIHIHNRARR